ncbi:MAG: OmpA family protein, partial [Deltaproteobacteria bacterium]
PQRAGCPSLDADGDGVFDGDDVCPTVPAGARPDPRRRGCPAGDRDGDSVLDDVDSCPDQPGAPSTDATRNGCPGLVRIMQQQLQILRPVFFATGREVILGESFPVLAAVADALQATGIRRLRIEGHTDNRGNSRHNLRLSQRRAESVRRWLVEHGIDVERLDAVGVGDARPVEVNTAEQGQAANRRVEFHIVEVDTSPEASRASSSAGPTLRADSP